MHNGSPTLVVKPKETAAKNQQKLSGPKVLSDRSNDGIFVFIK